MPSASPLSARTRIVVVGAGRLGRVLARALVTAGFRTPAPVGRGEDVPPADIVVLCVPDAEIANVAARLAGSDALVGHTSGATGLDGVDFGLHPLQTFTGDETPEVFHGIGCAVGGRSVQAQAAASALATALGARPCPLTDAARPAYHAAAALASNYLLAVLADAEQMLRAAVPDEPGRELLAPLVRRTVENWAAHGAASALTGPVARGDGSTVARQREAVAALSPEILPAFDALTARTRSLAGSAAR